MPPPHLDPRAAKPSELPPGGASAAPQRRFFFSLGLQVTVLVVLLVVTVASGVYLGLVRQSRLTLLSSKEVAAEMVVKLTSASVAPAVVFGDEQEMQRAVTNLAQNPDVSDVELWGFETSALGASEGLLANFHRAGSRTLGRPASGKSQRWRDADSVRVVEPVIDLNGTAVAALAVRFSTAREATALALLARQILYVSAATALCLAVAILLAVHRIVVRPIERLGKAARRLTRGEQPEVESRRSRVDDEVVRLADQFGEMAEAVRDRETRLGVRNAELKLILDSVDQGFLTARIDGSLLPERSAVVEKWVGALPPDASVWSLAGLIEPELEYLVNFAWQQLIDDFLPRDVALDQLPKQLHRSGQHFSLAYHPVLLDGRLQQVIIVMTDITAELERQRSLAEQHEFAALVEQFVRDRRAFHDFWAEASRLVTKIVDSQEEASESLRRNVHTLKGNARFFGLNRVAGLCHDLESAMAERGEYILNARERAAFFELWESLRERIEPVMHGANVFLEVSRNQYERLLDAVRQRKPAELEQIVRSLRYESVGSRLERGSALLADTCRKLGKTPPKVQVVHGDLRVPPEPWAPFWSAFSHVLNNAADHGLESDEERAAAGKPLPGNILLSTRVVDKEISIEVRDDGRGIDWEQVRKLAAARGLASRSRGDLEQALFAEGLSLKHEVSQVSGRGVGLAAVRGVVTALGGKIEVESSLHVGTTWRFLFPIALLTDSGLCEDPSRSPNPAEPRRESVARVD